jgi:hypothetical protein
VLGAVRSTIQYRSRRSDDHKNVYRLYREEQLYPRWTHAMHIKNTPRVA